MVIKKASTWIWFACCNTHGLLIRNYKLQKTSAFPWNSVKCILGGQTTFLVRIGLWWVGWILLERKTLHHPSSLQCVSEELKRLDGYFVFTSQFVHIQNAHLADMVNELSREFIHEPLGICNQAHGSWRTNSVRICDTTGLLLRKSINFCTLLSLEHKLNPTFFWPYFGLYIRQQGKNNITQVFEDVFVVTCTCASRTSTCVLAITSNKSHPSWAWALRCRKAFSSNCHEVEGLQKHWTQDRPCRFRVSTFPFGSITTWFSSGSTQRNSSETFLLRGWIKASCSLRMNYKSL